MNKVKCLCCTCDKEIIVEFLLPPKEEDKIGYVCKACAIELNIEDAEEVE